MPLAMTNAFVVCLHARRYCAARQFDDSRNNYLSDFPSRHGSEMHVHFFSAARLGMTRFSAKLLELILCHTANMALCLLGNRRNYSWLAWIGAETRKALQVVSLDQYAAADFLRL